MPVVKIINNIKFYFYSNEGVRPHIHVKLAEFEVQVWLDDLAIKQGCRSKAVQKGLVELVEKHQKELLDSWNEFFGE
jgi:hypothetical protein